MERCLGASVAGLAQLWELPGGECMSGRRAMLIPVLL